METQQPGLESVTWGDFFKQLEAAKRAAKRAGDVIAEIYRSGELNVELKQDNSPVGRADKASNSMLCRELHTTFPDYGILTEEEVEPQDRTPSLDRATESWRNTQYTWMIDPLDGTKDFIEKTGDFGIHIGLTDEGSPVLGVNYYPEQNTFYFAIKGHGAYKQVGEQTVPISTSENAQFSQMTPVTSRSAPKGTLKEMIEKENLRKPIQVGSMGKKLCAIADNAGDVYMMLSPSASLWDACSGQVILEEAGGRITTPQGEPINFRQQDTKIDEGLVASNGKNHKSIIQKISEYL